MASISSEIAYRVQMDAFDFRDSPVLRVNAADTKLPYTSHVDRCRLAQF